jgi:uncharacterized protein (TIGR02001 family)
MKKLSFLLIAVLVVAATVMVPAAQAVEVEGDAYVGYYDKYLWRGFDLSGGTPVVQGGVDLSAKGFTLSYWTNIQTKDDVVLGSEVNGGDATETDIVLDYSFDINDLLSASVGTIWYALDGLEDTKEAYLGLSLNTLLEPSVTVYYDYDQADENALFYTASVGHSLDLVDGLSLSLGALVSYNDESDYAVGNYSDWHNYELSVGLDYALNDSVAISPSFIYSSPISDEAKEAIDSEMVTGVSIAFAF